MRLILLAVLLSSCSMIHKTSSKHLKDSTAVIIDNSSQYTKIDSTFTSKNKEIETSDLVVVLKDTATGFVVLSVDSIRIPSSSIKEIRHKKSKQKQTENQTQLTKDQVIINDKKNVVTVKEKTVTKEKKSYKLNFWWLLVAIPIFLLYRYKSKIIGLLKAFTI